MPRIKESPRGPLVVLLAIIGALTMIGCHRTEPEVNRVAALEVISAYERAVNAGDVEAIMKLYADDAVWMPAESHPLVGKPAIRKRVQDALKQIALKKKWDVHEVILAGDWAFVRARGSGTVTERASGNEMSESRNELFLLHQRQDGVWEIARFMYNADSPVKHSEGSVGPTISDPG